MNVIELACSNITPDKIQRIEKANSNNVWVKDAYTVKSFLARVNKAPATEADVPF